MDHFSKWIWSYPLKNKTGIETLRFLKSYILSFAKINRLHPDNGTKFKNISFNNFCIDNNIKDCFSKPYTPKSAGAVESAHKQIKKLVYDQFYTLENEDFSFEEALLNAIDFHNNIPHSITLFKPVDIRDTNDENIIKTVNENIKNNISRVIKYKELYLLDSGEFIWLLIILKL